MKANMKIALEKELEMMAQVCPEDVDAKMENFEEYDWLNADEEFVKVREMDASVLASQCGKVLSDKEKFRRHRKANRMEIEKKALRNARAFEDGTPVQRATAKKIQTRKRRYAA